jgi:hypothetical protein
MSRDLFAPLRVLIACEFTGTVRRAFDALGHDVWSCDLRAAEDGSNRHIRADVRDVLRDGWDLMIVAHPPCTRLCNSGVRWLSVPPPGRELADLWRELDDGAALFSELWNAPVPRVAVENPVMHGHAKARIAGYQPPAQSVQPWQFGDFETKRTCLWLRGIAPLVPTYATLEAARRGLQLEADAQPLARVHRMPPGPDRERERSRFFPGIARAMAEQWGGNALQELAA